MKNRFPLYFAAFLTGAASQGFLNVAARESQKPVADLTGLSLEELYNMEIVQLNVLGAHTHPKKEVMFGYDFMYMEMSGYKVGTTSLTPEEVLKNYGYPVVHQKMEMQMHMFEAMYAFTDDLTVMGMMPYKNMSMRHLMADGERFTQNGDGAGDFQAMAL
ncbi:MAG TPA: hypothetical protein VGR78_18770, partial [Verrucomicrobiae bacterium]|nr:hypothetical protein [Verrucomicrobiae bacterium]